MSTQKAPGQQKPPLLRLIFVREWLACASTAQGPIPSRDFRSEPQDQPSTPRLLARAGCHRSVSARLRLDHPQSNTKNAIMDRHTPPSPTPTKAEPMPSWFNELLQHNSSAPYPGEPIPTTESIPAHLQPGSRYGTPGPQLQHSQGIEAPMVYQHGGAGGDLVRRTHRRRRAFRRLTCYQQPYHQPAAYAQHGSPYGPVPEVSRQNPDQIKPHEY